MSDASQAAGAGGLPALRAGSMVGPGRFTLIKELGRGGMGVVWLAQDTRLDEQVALKFLPPEVAADPVALNDLRRETARSHRLTHPNIIRLHDFHQQPDGIAFISMEYVDGMTLSGWRLQQPKQVFGWEQLAPLVQQLCAALEYAHSEGVIHRDLKPANVMLDQKGRVKLADFGIAAVVSDSASRVSVRSRTGGTLPYMSPQQVAGEEPRAADDLYALGATLYELLSGRPPFYRGDITHQVLNVAARPLPERMLEVGIDNPVPGDVAALILACLAKEPTQRPQSARAVAEWVGLEITRKTSVESLAEAMFPAGDSGQGGASAEQLPAAGAGPAVSKRKLALLLSGTMAALLLAGAGVWYAAGHRAARSESTSPGTSPPASVSAGHPGSPASATKESPWTNSLGMPFVPVPGTKVLFCVWETRVQDFKRFVDATGYPVGDRMYGHRKDGWRERDGEGWSNPGFAQGPDHPVVGVNWEEAGAFCRWLTEKERKERSLDGAREYRLPTDAEWSRAVGPSRYPWGETWPPPAGAGNYASEETLDGNQPRGMRGIAGYRDGYARTAPVGSFSPNGYGLYDMGGNAWEWCLDWYRKEMNDPAVLAAFPVLRADGGGRTYRVYRGGGWNDARWEGMLSANRMGDGFAYPAKRYDNTGFRVVFSKAGEMATSGQALPEPSANGTATLAEGRADAKLRDKWLKALRPALNELDDANDQESAAILNEMVTALERPEGISAAQLAAYGQQLEQRVRTLVRRGAIESASALNIALWFARNEPGPGADRPASERATRTGGKPGPDGSVLHYTFDAASPDGTVRDASGAGNDGRVVGAEWVATGRQGGAYRFHLTNLTDRIVVPDSETLHVEQVTLAAWIQTRATNGFWSRIIDKDWRKGYNISLAGDLGNKARRGKANFEVNNQGILSDGRINDGRWHQLVGTYDGRTRRLYVDGVEQKAKSGLQPGPISINHWEVGIGNSRVDYGTGEFLAFDGLIADVRIYNRALTAAEARQLYASFHP